MKTRATHNKFYRIAFWAGIAAVFLLRRNLGAEAAMLNYFGAIQPGLIDVDLSIAVVQAVFSNILAGFLYFDFFDSVHAILILLLFIPIFIECFRTAPRISLVAIIMLSLSIVYYSISSMALPLLINLNNPHCLEVLISYDYIFKGLQYVGLVLFYGFGILISVIMRRQSIFTRYSYVLGLISNGIGILYFPLLLVTHEYAHFAIVAAAPFTVAWHANITFNIRKKLH